MNDKNQSCEKCIHWDKKGLTNKNFDNEGICTWMIALENKKKKISFDPDIPFWADRLIYTTISWEGNSCKAFKERKRGKK